MKNPTSALLTLLIGTALGVSAGTLSIPFSGAFTFDNDVVLFDVFLQTPAHLSVYTTSYAAGGFATHLEMYDGAGTTQFAMTDGGVPACVPDGPSPVRPPGLCQDSEIHEGPFLTDLLSAGHYLVALSQAGNYSSGYDIHEPFTHDGVAGRNYTAVSGICDEYFCDPFFLTPNTSSWAAVFQLDTPSGAVQGAVTQLGTVPEPQAAVLVLGGAAAMAVIARRRRASQL